MSRYKQPALHECARDYLEDLAADLEARKIAGEAINEAFLARVKAAIPTAPSSFILHRIDR